MRQVIGNKRKWKEAMEGLKSSRELAKQVFSKPRLLQRCLKPLYQSVGDYFRIARQPGAIAITSYKTTYEDLNTLSPNRFP